MAPAGSPAVPPVRPSSASDSPVPLLPVPVVPVVAWPPVKASGRGPVHGKGGASIECGMCGATCMSDTLDIDGARLG